MCALIRFSTVIILSDSIGKCVPQAVLAYFQISVSPNMKRNEAHDRVSDPKMCTLMRSIPRARDRPRRARAAAAAGRGGPTLLRTPLAPRFGRAQACLNVRTRNKSTSAESGRPCSLVARISPLVSALRRRRRVSLALHASHPDRPHRWATIRLTLRDEHVCVLRHVRWLIVKQHRPMLCVRREAADDRRRDAPDTLGMLKNCRAKVVRDWPRIMNTTGEDIDGKLSGRRVAVSRHMRFVEQSHGRETWGRLTLQPKHNEFGVHHPHARGIHRLFDCLQHPFA